MREEDTRESFFFANVMGWRKIMRLSKELLKMQLHSTVIAVNVIEVSSLHINAYIDKGHVLMQD